MSSRLSLGLPLALILAATGCASVGGTITTRAQATVPRPEPASEDTVAWRQYWEDQFEVGGENVVPPADYFSPAAKYAYEVEQRAFQERARARGGRAAARAGAVVAGTAAVYTVVYVVAALLGGLLIALIL